MKGLNNMFNDEKLIAFQYSCHWTRLNIRMKCQGVTKRREWTTSDNPVCAFIICFQFIVY